MPQVTDKPLLRLCTRLYEEDVEYLTNMAEVAPSGISRDMILREIVHNYVTRVRDGERTRMDRIKIEAQPESVSEPV